MSSEAPTKTPGRPLGFDPDQVVMSATMAFWRHGYRATSTDILFDATGLSASSLYNTFGSKRDLFVVALDHYNSMLTQLFEPLEQGTTGLGDIEQFLDRLVASKRSEGAIGGCLLTNTLADQTTNDPDIVARAQAYPKRLRNACLRPLRQAVELGEIAPDTPDDLAQTLTAALIGIFVTTRSCHGDLPDEHIQALKATITRWRTDHD